MRRGGDGASDIALSGKELFGTARKHLTILTGKRTSMKGTMRHKTFGHFGLNPRVNSKLCVTFAALRRLGESESFRMKKRK